MSWRVSVCHCVPYRPQSPLRLVKTWIHGTIAVQNLVKIDQNAQKSAKTANKKRPRKEAFLLANYMIYRYLSTCRRRSG